MVMLPTVVTMGLAGVWHGAGLQFLIFGLLHVTYLSINHACRIFRPRRSQAVGAALDLLGGMTGLHGIDAVALPASMLARLGGSGRAPVSHGLASGLSANDVAATPSHALWVAALYAGVWSLPNTQQIMRRFTPALGRIQPGPFEALAWQPSRGWAAPSAPLPPSASWRSAAPRSSSTSNSEGSAVR